MTKSFEYEIMPQERGTVFCFLIERERKVVSIPGNPFAFGLIRGKKLYEGTYCECLFQQLRLKSLIDEQQQICTS